MGHVLVSAHRGQKRRSHTLVVLSCLTLVLGPELGSSGRALSVLTSPSALAIFRQTDRFNFMCMTVCLHSHMYVHAPTCAPGA